MNHLCKYNQFSSINESQQEDIKKNIIDIMQEFVDDGYDITFSSYVSIGSQIKCNIKAEDFYKKTDKLKEFSPTIKAGNKIRSKFTITFNFKGRRIKYNELVKIIDDMSSAISRFEDLGWNLCNFNINNDGGSVTESMWYGFSKLDIPIEGETNSNINENKIKEAFESVGLVVKDIEIEEADEDDGMTEYEIKVEFDSTEWDGRLPGGLETTFQQICDTLGFTTFDYTNGYWYVTFLDHS